jgi:hypothetical protein
MRPAEGRAEATRQVLCFACHQADLKRQRAIRDAGNLDTASEARFQAQLPFEPVNRPRLDRLRAERATIRAGAVAGAGRFEVRRRQAQVAACHALQGVVSGIRPRGSVTPEESRVFAAAVHAAELQLPEAWLPFVVAR